MSLSHRSDHHPGADRPSAPSRWRARCAPVVAVAVAAFGGIGATVAVARTGQSTGRTPTTGTTKAPSLPPAPPGFASSLTSLYAKMYETVTTLQGKTGRAASQQLSTPSAFSQEVNSLTPDQLATIYTATTKAPNWSAMGPDTQKLLSDAQSQPAPPKPGSVRRAPRRGATASHRPAVNAARVPSARHLAMPAAAGSPFPPTEPTGAFPAPLSPFQASPAVNPFAPMTCVSGPSPYAYYIASDTTIYVAQVVADSAEFAASYVPDTEVVYTPFIGNTSYPVPVKAVVEAIALAAQTVVNSFTYAEDVANACDGANTGGFTANVDKTTVNTFGLEQQNEQTLAFTESSVNTVHDQIHVVEQSLQDELTAEIQQALSLPASTPADVYYALPASVGGNLDSTPVGVQTVVNNAFSGARHAGLPVNASASSYLNAANQAYQAHQYRTAWKDYQLAYQALGG